MSVDSVDAVVTVVAVGIVAHVISAQQSAYPLAVGAAVVTAVDVAAAASPNPYPRPGESLKRCTAAIGIRTGDRHCTVHIGAIVAGDVRVG